MSQVYPPLTGKRIVGFIPFSRVLAICEMYRASSTVSFSYDDNHYTMSASYPFTHTHTHTGFFSLGMATSLGEGKFKIVKLT